MNWQDLVAQRRVAAEPAALEAADRDAYGAFASYFDVCRVLRNELSYNAAEVVTEAELDELVPLVKQFARVVAARLAARHPELR